jgi:hypothetical protein
MVSSTNGPLSKFPCYHLWQGSLAVGVTWLDAQHPEGDQG